MNYTANIVEDQQLMFHIKMEHNGDNIAFNVVCAEDESEIPDLIQVHLDMLDNPPAVNLQPVEQVDQMGLIEKQQASIEALEARIAALEA